MRVLVLLSVLAVTPVLDSAELVMNGGFEIDADFPGPPFGIPTEFGQWAGDISEIVTARDGIDPYDGAKMLRFVDSSFSGPSVITDAADIRQHIDVGSLSASILAQEVFRATARFNRVPGDAETDSEFRITIEAMQGTPDGYLDVSNELQRFDASIFTDADPSTWEIATLDFVPPVGTDYLALRVRAIENVANDSNAPEFDGHYVDAVSLVVVPEPSSFAACLCGTVFLSMFCHTSFRNRKV